MPLATVLVTLRVLVHDPYSIFLVSVGAHEGMDQVLNIMTEIGQAGSSAGQ